MDDQSCLQVDDLNIKSPKGVHDRWQDNQSPHKATKGVIRAIKTTIDGLQWLEKSEIYINHLKTKKKKSTVAGTTTMTRRRQTSLLIPLQVSDSFTLDSAWINLLIDKFDFITFHTPIASIKMMAGIGGQLKRKKITLIHHIAKEEKFSIVHLASNVHIMNDCNIHQMSSP